MRKSNLWNRLRQWSIYALATAAGLGLLYFTSKSAQDLQRVALSVQTLYSRLVGGLSLQGELEYWTQESRRTFLYVLTTDSMANQEKSAMPKANWPQSG